VRTRVPEILNDLDAVVDVGAVYEPGPCSHTAPSWIKESNSYPRAARHRYDHHQKEFHDFFGHGFKTRLSSAGLIYKHFGQEVIASELGRKADDPVVSTVLLQVYKTFMEAIDGIDNGVSQYEGVPKYLSSTDLSSRVGHLNPTWQQEATPALADAQFVKAMQLAGEEWLEAVRYTANVWLPGREPVQAALAARHEVHPSGKIVQLATYCPWKSHIYDLEQEMGLTGETLPLYVLYEDEKKNWRVQAISVGPNSFECRKALPWRGLRDEQLSEASGVPGGIFVHVTGFIGGNKTQAGAKEMAIKALTLE